MPNIATVFREEITRLARKENRSQNDQTKKATTQHRRDIAMLKRQVTQLERQIKQLTRRTAGSGAKAPQAEAGKKARFVAKGLRSQRLRLGLSAGDFGKLVGVSAQSIYNWESESSRPRVAQFAKLAALRGIGKREADTRLKQLSGRKA